MVDSHLAPSALSLLPAGLDDPLKPSESLLAGRRALDGLPGVELIEDWQWMPESGGWALLVRLTIEPGEAARLPRATDWYFRVDPGYPFGRILVYPAKKGGLTQTFPHQYENRLDDSNLPWRTGNICAHTGAQGMERYVATEEPWSAGRRLAWYVQRSRTWLEAAAADDLLRAGEPFELPHFPLDSATDCTVAFHEDPQSFALWAASPHSHGVFEYAEFPHIRQAVLAQRFYGQRKHLIVDLPWGEAAKVSASDGERGVWIRLPALPVLGPWQAPTTWGELADAAATMGVDLWELLEPASHFVRDGHAHLGLLGFPIPTITGESPDLMHWQAFRMPALAHGSEHRNGFRPTKEHHWDIDRRRVFAAENPIKWLQSANWSAGEITARGSVQEAVRRISVAVIGAGALGSVVSEMLVRAGIEDLLIIDHDTLEIGNLVRHSLTMRDLGRLKAEAVAERLSGVSPNVEVDALTAAFPPTHPERIERINQADVIIDTTGSDEVVTALASFPWTSAKLQISASLSLGARGMYLFAFRGVEFPVEDFQDQVRLLLERDAEEWGDAEMPWAGAGCWHPVFPARVDDIWLLAAAGVKQILGWIERPPEGPLLRQIVQMEDQEAFTGVSIQ